MKDEPIVPRSALYGAMWDALDDIARQKTTPELVEDGNEVGNLEYAYNTIITRAREALSRTA